MIGLTCKEAKKVHEITERLSNLSSPVLRIQAILQFSQIVDMLAIGDTSSDRELELVKQLDDLQNRLDIFENDDE